MLTKQFANTSDGTYAVSPIAVETSCVAVDVADGASVFISRLSRVPEPHSKEIDWTLCPPSASATFHPGVWFNDTAPISGRRFAMRRREFPGGVG
jgi:hypothetical protein